MTSAESLLADARSLAARDEELGATAARAAALLGRSALEEAIWSFAPSLREVNSRAMLLTISVALDRTGPRAAMVWGRLTTACHHHAYELPPTATELTHLLDTVEEVIIAIRARQAEARRRRAGQG